MGRLIGVRPVEGLGEITSGDILGAIIAEAARPATSEVIVVSQKIVSKAEDRVRSLAAVTPGDRALALAGEVGKDPRLIELILAEAARIIRAEPGVLIVKTKSGLV